MTKVESFSSYYLSRCLILKKCRIEEKYPEFDDFEFDQIYK